MDMSFWGVKNHGSENSHGTEVKCSNLRQKKLNFKQKSCKLNVKLNVFTFKTLLQMSLEVLIAKILTDFHENESRKFWIRCGFDVHFTSFPQFSKFSIFPSFKYKNN
jgi:hypothetical protein